MRQREAGLVRSEPSARLLRIGNPVFAAGLGAACISSSAILVKLADTGTATTAFYRCLFALPALVMLTVSERRRRGRRRAAARAGALAAGLFLAADLVLWNHAIADVGAGVATVLGNLQVLFVALAAWLLLGERPHATFLLSLPVVLAGVVLVGGLVSHSGAGAHPLGGVIYGLATSVAYAAFLLTLRQASAGTPHIAGPVADVTAGGAVGSLLLGLVFGGFQVDPGWPSFGWLLLLAIGSQTAGWLLITSSLPRLPAALSSLLLLLQPAAALLLAAVVLGERPTALQLAGAGMVCFGVVTASRRRSTSGTRNIVRLHNGSRGVTRGDLALAVRAWVRIRFAVRIRAPRRSSASPSRSPAPPSPSSASTAGPGR